MADVIQGPKTDAQRVARSAEALSWLTRYSIDASNNRHWSTRCVTTVHRGSQQSQHGPADVGGPDIAGGKR